MKKNFPRLMISIFYSFLGLALFILISCGGGGGGHDNSADTTTTDQPTTTSIEQPAPTPTQTTSGSLLGNFTFVYQIISIYTDRITLYANSHEQTDEGTDLYIGYNATYPDVTFSNGAWYPSISCYMIVTIPTYDSIYWYAHYFIINPDNTLSGCYILFTNDVPSYCYSFIIPQSHKSPLGSWNMISSNYIQPTDMNDLFEMKRMEVEEQKTASTAPIVKGVKSKMEAQETVSLCPVDKNLITKTIELRDIAKRQIQQ